MTHIHEYKFIRVLLEESASGRLFKRQPIPCSKEGTVEEEVCVLHKDRFLVPASKHPSLHEPEDTLTLQTLQPMVTFFLEYAPGSGRRGGPGGGGGGGGLLGRWVAFSTSTARHRCSGLSCKM